MSELVGHERVREALEKSLPRVTLLLGPEGTGKRVLAGHVARHWAGEHQLAQVVFFENIDVQDARQLVRIVRHAAPGLPKFLTLDLDGAGEQAQNILLKVMEEPPDSVWFILLASMLPLATVMSRAQVHRTGRLSEEQVRQVLLRKGVKDAAKYAALGGGSVSAALLRSGQDEESSRRVRGVLSAALRASSAQDWEALARSMRSWEKPNGHLLLEWAAEAATGQWREFTPQFAPGFSCHQASELWKWVRPAPSSVNLVAWALRRVTSER